MKSFNFFHQCNPKTAYFFQQPFAVTKSKSDIKRALSLQKINIYCIGNIECKNLRTTTRNCIYSPTLLDIASFQNYSPIKVSTVAAKCAA